jgi:hypothetical protein
MNKTLSCILLAALLQSSLSFSVKPAVISRPASVFSRSSSELFSTPDEGEEKAPAAVPLPPPQPTCGLDPLVASVTRMDPSSSGANQKMTNVPFFGEIPTEGGGLKQLAAAAGLGVVGFLLFFVMAFNARDSFGDQMTQISEDINSAALAKTNKAPVDPNACRGLCSSQDQQLESMRSFMQGISKK